MIHAYAASQVGGALAPFAFDPGPLPADEVEIAVAACGICHSDLSMLDNEWGMSRYPFVPGHEVAGHIRAVGAAVRNFRVGDRVGLGWHAGYCGTCSQCNGGDHNLCATATGTIVGRHGGFADAVRAKAQAVVRVPEGLDLKAVGPLFCGGITVFNPLLQFHISPSATAAVIGIGGLGHLAVKFLSAWGCHVTAFTSSPDKQAEARAFGAHATLNSRRSEELAAAAGRFDLIISTVNVSLDWPTILSTLAPKGRLHLVGATLEPVPVPAFSLLSAQRQISGSPVGSPHSIASMLEFAARHQITPQVEYFPLTKVNEAMAHVRAGKARYRVVLVNET